MAGVEQYERRSRGLWSLGAEPVGEATGSNAPDWGRRLAFVMLANRLYHPDPALSDAAHFARALTRAGAPATADDVRTWEAAVAAPSYEVITAWEQVCERAPGELTSVCGFVREQVPDNDAPEIAPRLKPGPLPSDALRVRLSTHTMRPSDWMEIGWRCRQFGPPPAEDAALVATALLRQYPRTQRTSYRLYSQVACALAEQPQLQEAIVAAVGAYLTDPDVQVLHPITLLARVPTRTASRLVLDLFEQPETAELSQFAALVVTAKAAQAHFDEAERGRLVVSVLARWRDDPDRAQRELAQLVAVLPQGVRSALSRGAPNAGGNRFRYVMRHGELATARTAEEVSTAVSRAVVGMVPEHAVSADSPMLRLLIREALFRAEPERRFVAADLIGTTPLRHAVCERLLDVIEDYRYAPGLQRRAARALHSLAGDEHRLRLLRLCQGRDEALVAELVAVFAVLTPSQSSDLALRQGLGPTSTVVGRARMLALGMTGSPALESLAQAPAPPWQQRAARWWQAMGPRI